MKNMKKKFICAAVLVALMVTAVACSRVDTAAAATVVLQVDSPALAETISVTASKGTVTASDKTFTVALPDRRGAVVTVSADGFKTVTLRFGASDFKESATVTRTVELKTGETSIVQIGVSGVSGASVTAGDCPVTKHGSTFTIEASAEAFPLDVAVSGTDCETRHITVRADMVKSGYYSRTVRLAGAGKRLIETIGYDGSAFTRDFKPITATRESNGGEENEVLYFEISADDVLLLTGRDDDIVAVDGAKIPVYGQRYVAKHVSASTAPALTAKLYCADEQNNYPWEFYVKVGDDYVELGRSEEYDYKTGKYRYYLTLPGACEVYCYAYGNEDYRRYIYAYEITEEILTQSVASPVLLLAQYDRPDSLPCASKVEMGAERRAIYIYNGTEYELFYIEGMPDSAFDNYSDAEQSLENQYLQSLWKRVFRGTYFEYQNYYNPITRLTFRVKGDVSGEDFSVYPTNSGDLIDTVYNAAMDETTLKFKGAVDESNGFGFRITRFKHYDTAQDTNSVELNSEMYYYYLSEMTATTDGYSLGELKYHDYVRLSNWISNDLFDLSFVDSYRPEGIEGIDSNFYGDVTLVMEGALSDGSYKYVRLGTPVRIRIERSYYGYNGYALVAFDSEQTFTAEEMSVALQKADRDDPIRLTFAVTELSKKIYN